MNQKIIECLNKHFWRRDDFGLISYPISPDGRTADARTIQEQFGKEGGDGSDGLLRWMIRKATKAFGERASLIYSTMDFIKTTFGMYRNCVLSRLFIKNASSVVFLTRLMTLMKKILYLKSISFMTTGITCLWRWKGSTLIRVIIKVIRP